MKDVAVTRTGWVLFAAMSVIWGVPYFFIRVAVEDLEPPVVVFGRSFIGAVVLLVLAARTGAIRPALKHWKPVVAFGILEMAVPWILLTSAEQHIPSGLTALLVSCVPMVGAVAAYVLGDRTALRFIRVLGILVGLGGVALLVGRDLSGGESPPVWSIVALLAVCVCYATAPFIVSRRLVGVPSLGVIALSLSVVAVIYAPLAGFAWPSETPPADSLLAVLVLGLVCTALAFVVFFKLIAEIGPPRAMLITFVNPVVAVTLGAVFLDEVITGATVAGTMLILTGCWLATRPAPRVVAERSEVLDAVPA